MSIMEIITRSEAVSKGFKKYFTGVPCKNGHISQRYTVSTLCLACNAEAQKNQRTNINLALTGVVPVTVKTHRNDHAAILAYADLLNLQRGLSVQNSKQPGAPAASPSPAPAAPAAPTVSAATVSPYQRWVALHGRVIADQMADQYGVDKS